MTATRSLRFVKQRFVSLALGAKVSVGHAADTTSVRDLVAGLRPVSTRHGLVRLGVDGDGGYLVPDDLEGLRACFSPGVDDRASFESDLLARGVPCYLADRSVARAPLEHAMVDFRPVFVDVVDGPGRVSLDTWVRECAPAEGDLILQMDIEGNEWATLLATPRATLERFRIVVIELHDLERSFDEFGLRVIRGCIDRLREVFEVVHLHPNNYRGSIRHHGVEIPQVLEMTLLRRDRVGSTVPTARFPHALDVKNAPHLPDQALPADWFVTR